jgi:Spy/CpxP family protein refolding chaperone
MRELIRSKAVGYLIAIFIAGLAAGAAGGFAWSKCGRSPKGPHPDPKQMVDRILSGLTHELKLTEDQVLEIRPLIEQTSEQIHACHEDLGKRIGELIKEGNRRMEAFLTPEQKRKLAELERQREERFRKGPPPPRPHQPGS